MHLLQDPQIAASIHKLVIAALESILACLGTALTYGVKLWIDSMQSAWKRAVANRLVSYAEQRFPDDATDSKYQFVAKAVSDHFPSLKQDEVAHLIEEAVVNVKAKMAQSDGPVQVVMPPTLATTTTTVSTTEAK